MSSFGNASNGKGGSGHSYRHSNYNHPSPTRSNSQSSSTGLPTPAASPQALSPTAQNYSMLSTSPTHAQQPRRLHNMSISSILSPDSSHRSPTAGAGRAESHGVESDVRIHPPMTFNEDPKKIESMLEGLNPGSPEWVVWKEWSDWLAEGKPVDPVDKKKMARWIAEEEAHAKAVRARNAAIKMESST